jgi:predicted lipid-binding transport protein (Tim44 family)
MKSFSILAAVLALGLTLNTVDADAKRLGGSKSVGMQRQNTADKAAAPAPTNSPGTPASTATANNPAGAAASTAAAGAASQAKRSWMGPLAGLAAGLGLAALASHFGFGDELASMMMFGLIAFAVIALIGFVLRKRAAAAGGMNRSPLAASAAGTGTSNRGFEASMPAAQPMQRSQVGDNLNQGGSIIGSGLAPSAMTGVQRNIPADFDVAAFVRNAKVNFIRMQAANDAGNLDDLRQFTTPEMFAELKMDIVERGTAAQHTEVVNVEADVLDVAEENGQYVVSVRFTGHVLEEKHQPAEAFDEVWHMTKPLQGSGGWVIAGIQQLG